MGIIEGINRDAENVFRAIYETSSREKAKPLSKAEVGLTLAKETEERIGPSLRGAETTDARTAATIQRIHDEGEQVFRAVFDTRA